MEKLIEILNDAIEETERLINEYFESDNHFKYYTLKETLEKLKKAKLELRVAFDKD